MIASLTGLLRHKAPTEIIIDVQGVGYAIHIPFSTYEKLGELNSTATLLTYLQVREDAMQLYGFFTEEERFYFKLLISVSGIGPRIAQGILSGISVDDLGKHIASGNILALTAIPGVGKKTAERMIIELRDKIGKLDTVHPSTAAQTSLPSDTRYEAMLALTSLGYPKPVAEKAIRLASSESGGTEPTLQDLIKRALRHTTTK
ncbi:MAG: Holliday junction branch migration protein RuvA [bacterium]